MSGLPLAEQIGWRLKLDLFIRKYNQTDNRISFIHPPNYYNYEHKCHKTDREIIDWELKQVYDSDIVVVNFEGIESTIGTHIELGAVNGINRFGNKYIHVIGIGDETKVHPWIKESCLRIEKNIEDAAKYIAEYMLI